MPVVASFGTWIDHGGAVRQVLRHQCKRNPVHRSKGIAAYVRRWGHCHEWIITSIKGAPAFSVYAATKAAVRSFARSWASDLRGRDIRVNVVSPGTVVTPAYKSELGLSDEEINEFVRRAAEVTPLGRAGTPDEIAKAVSFLASDDASYVTGIELFVDGGQAQI